LCWIGYPFPIERGIVLGYDTNADSYIQLTEDSETRHRPRLLPIYESN
jgi:hypothetical protein